jgi:hypothetical protein
MTFLCWNDKLIFGHDLYGQVLAEQNNMPKMIFRSLKEVEKGFIVIEILAVVTVQGILAPAIYSLKDEIQRK